MRRVKRTAISRIKIKRNRTHSFSWKYLIVYVIMYTYGEVFGVISKITNNGNDTCPVYGKKIFNKYRARERNLVSRSRSDRFAYIRRNVTFVTLPLIYFIYIWLNELYNCRVCSLRYFIVSWTPKFKIQWNITLNDGPPPVIWIPKEGIITIGHPVREQKV